MYIYLLLTPTAILGLIYFTNLVLRVHFSKKNLTRVNRQFVYMAITLFLSWLFGFSGLILHNNFIFFGANVATTLMIYYVNAWRIHSLKQENPKEAQRLIIVPIIFLTGSIITLFQIVTIVLAGNGFYTVTMADNSQLIKNQWLTIGDVAVIAHAIVWVTIHTFGLYKAYSYSHDTAVKYRYSSYIIPASTANAYLILYLLEIIAYQFNFEKGAGVFFSVRIIIVVLALPIAFVMLVRLADKWVFSKYQNWKHRKLEIYAEQLKPFFCEVEKHFPIATEYNPYELTGIARVNPIISRLNDVRRMIFRGEALRMSRRIGNILDASKATSKYTVEAETKLWFDNLNSPIYSLETRKLNQQNLNPPNAVPKINEANNEVAIKHYMQIARKLKINEEK